MWNTKHTEALAVGTMLVLTLGAATAGAAPRDRISQADGIALHPLQTIAVLPAVAVDGDELAQCRAEVGWVTMYAKASTRWMPAEEVRRRMAAASGGSGDLAGAVKGQIWRNGGVDARTAARLAQLLGVDAVLSLRVDRWEIADGGRGMVELEAVLSAADGTRLWSASGLAGHGHGRLSNEGNFSMGLKGFWDPRLEPDNSNHRTCAAFCALLTRWATALPVPVYERDMPVEMVAHARQDQLEASLH